MQNRRYKRIAIIALFLSAYGFISMCYDISKLM